MPRMELVRGHGDVRPVRLISVLILPQFLEFCRRHRDVA
jgi:hypothetical protein